MPIPRDAPRKRLPSALMVGLASTLAAAFLAACGPVDSADPASAAACLTDCQSALRGPAPGMLLALEDAVCEFFSGDDAALDDEDDCDD